MKKIVREFVVFLSLMMLTACNGGLDEFTVAVSPPAQEPGNTAAISSPAEAGESTVPEQQRDDVPGHEEREIWCDKGGQEIYGIASIPKGKGKFPLVIFSHGLASTHEDGKMYADRLVAEGVAVYSFDFCGGADDSKSDGMTTEMSVMTEAEDLRTVLDAAKTWDFVDTNKIVLMGLSQGGLVSAIAAAKWEDEIAGLILCYPAFLLQEEVHGIFKNREDIPDTNFYRGITVGRKYFEDVWEYNVYDEIAKYKKKVLLLHGDEDQTVDISYSERAAKVYADVEFYPIGGANHFFSDEALDEAYQHITKYLREIGVI